MVVVLVAVISLTVGLAAVSRSVTNTRVSTEESNSQKALNAAEAGLEEQIKRANDNIDCVGDDCIINSDFDNNSGYVATIDTTRKPFMVFNNYEVAVSKTEGADVWLSDYPDFTNSMPSVSLDIFWKNSSAGGCGTGPNANPAIEVVVLRGPNRNAPQLDRYAVDGCPSRSSGFANPSGGGASVDGHDFDHRFRISNITNGYIVRIIPIYNDAFIAARTVGSPAPNLPKQGFTIESEGTAGEARRKVKVFQSFPTVPIEIFPYNLFNP